MSNVMISQGDYVCHREFPHVVWEVRDIDHYTSSGGEATLKWVGGRITYEQRKKILEVYEGGDVALLRKLIPANPMLVIAYSSR